MFEKEHVGGLEHIPEFSEPKFFLTRGAIGQWIVSWREGNRVLALAPPWDSEQIARNQCRVLNELFEALPASASPQAKGEDWQSIASVPQDRRWVLVWQEDAEYSIYRFGPGLIEEPDDVQWTHWQPLPPPPSARPASLDEP